MLHTACKKAILRFLPKIGKGIHNSRCSGVVADIGGKFTAGIVDINNRYKCSVYLLFKTYSFLIVFFQLRDRHGVWGCQARIRTLTCRLPILSELRRTLENLLTVSTTPAVISFPTFTLIAVTLAANLALV